MSNHLCLQCGGELALSFNPSRMNVENAARTPITGWRCSTCGSTFTSEQLRGAKVKPVLPSSATSWPPSAAQPILCPVLAQLVYPDRMDHLGVLREKIIRLRAEIAEIQELNRQYRQRRGNGTAEQVAHGQRHERLQEIQKELGRLAALGRSVVSINEVREQNRSRLQLIKKSRAS